MKIEEIGEKQGARIFWLGSGKKPVKIDLFSDTSMFCNCKQCYYTKQFGDCTYKKDLRSHLGIKERQDLCSGCYRAPVHCICDDEQ